jgi:MFS family permease
VAERGGSADVPSPALRRSRRAVTVAFATQAIPFASWTAHIPLVAERLRLDDGALGTALLGAPIGSVLAMMITGWLLPRVGSAVIVRVTAVGYLGSGVVIGLADDVVALFAVLALWGAFQGALGVAMNTQGVAVERAYGRPIMSGLHAGWSIGALLGALIGSAAVAAGLPLLPQLVSLGVVLVVVNLLAGRHLLAGDRRQPDDRGRAGAQRDRVFSPMVLLLGGIALACMLCEGAAADWSAKYLHGSLGASAGFAGLAYAGYAAAMLTARLAGGWLLTRYRPRSVLPALSAAATLAMAVALLVGHPVPAVLAFAVLGLGLASVVPSAFTAAGLLSRGHAGGAIATVSAMGWVGFMIGPPAIGHLADRFSLPVALIAVPVLTAVITAGIRFGPMLGRPAAVTPVGRS